MSLKKFVMSGIQDVLDSQLAKNRGGSSQNNQPSSNQPMNSGYNQNSGGGYQPSPSSSYPQGGSSYPQPQSGGYPPQAGGYQPKPGGYPPQQGGYPSQPGYPQAGGYPSQQPSPYPTQPGYPGAQPGYPVEEIGYPSQPYGGAPSGQIGFNTPASGAGYPPSGPGYPSSGPGYPSSGPGYPSSGPGYPNSGYPNAGYPNSSPAPPSYPPTSQPSYNQQPSGFGSGYAPQQQYGSQGSYQPYNNTPLGHSAAPMLGTPSVRNIPNNANADAETLRKAMKGLGCNNSKVISVLCGRTNAQRQEIAKAFKVMYGKDLIKDLQSELSGDFEDVILALMDPMAIYDAKQLRKAMQGLGTKESVLIEIMTSRTNEQIYAVKMAYRQLYGRDLEHELIGETSGCFKRLLVSLCAGGRDESMQTDALRANQDARKLYSAGERRLGTDESAFNAILASQNFAQLRLVFDEYQKVTKHSIEQAIQSEFSGDICDGFLAVIAVVRNRPAYFASLLHKSMKGLGTRDNDLIRVVVSRCEIDMVDIRNAFQAMYKTSLENFIKGDCSGAYKDALITLVNGN